MRVERIPNLWSFYLTTAPEKASPVGPTGVPLLFSYTDTLHRYSLPLLLTIALQ